MPLLAKYRSVQNEALEMGMADEEAWVSPSFIIVLDGESEYDTRWITTALLESVPSPSARSF